MYNTTATFRYAKICFELIIDQICQLCKRWLASRTRSNAHITTMQRAIAQDCFWRFPSLILKWFLSESFNQSGSEKVIESHIIEGNWLRANAYTSNGSVLWRGQKMLHTRRWKVQYCLSTRQVTTLTEFGVERSRICKRAVRRTSGSGWK